MSKGLLDIIADKIVDSFFDENWIGRRGEKLTERELNFVRLFGRSGKVLRNIYVPKKNNETSEIDVLFLTEKGIFVIESKNYSGWIFGNEKDRFWTASLGKSEKNKFYNPVMQNCTHIKWLKRYLQDDIPMFNLIVFSERCELKKVSIESDEIKVIKRDSVYATVRDIWNKSESVLDENKVQDTFAKLIKLTNVDQDLKQAHIDSIHNCYKEKGVIKCKPKVQSMTTKRSNRENEPDDLICPRCGAKLVKRTAKKGVNAGNKFWGCSAFPRCRYIKDEIQDVGGR